MKPNTLSTRNPFAYRTGGSMMRQWAFDECDLAAIVADTSWPNAMNGGPIDAPEVIPTGRVSVVHGYRFYEFAYRETNPCNHP